MGSRRQFKVNLTSYNDDWLTNEADYLQVSKTELVNRIIEDRRKKSGAKNVPKACTGEAIN